MKTSHKKMYRSNKDDPNFDVKYTVDGVVEYGTALCGSIEMLPMKYKMDQVNCDKCKDAFKNIPLHKRSKKAHDRSKKQDNSI